MGKGSRANWGPLHGIGGTQGLSSRGGPTFTGILTFVPRKKLRGNPGGQTRHDIFPGVRPAEGLGTAKGVPGGGGGLGAELGFPVPGACGPYQDSRAPLESLVLAIILVSAARSQSPRTSPPLKCPCRQSCSQSREKGPNQASQHRCRRASSDPQHRVVQAVLSLPLFCSPLRALAQVGGKAQRVGHWPYTCRPRFHPWYHNRSSDHSPSDP